jgi:hypothetical protein
MIEIIKRIAKLLLGSTVLLLLTTLFRINVALIIMHHKYKHDFRNKAILIVLNYVWDIKIDMVLKVSGNC